jgi:hypothetical protein
MVERDSKVNKSLDELVSEDKKLSRQSGRRGPPRDMGRDDRRGGGRPREREQRRSISGGGRRGKHDISNF